MTQTALRTRFEEDLEPLLGSLFGVALRYTRNRADAEDLVQTTALKAWRAYDRFEPEGEGSFRAWLFRILHNAWISEHRRKTRRPVEVAAESEDGFSLFDALMDATGSAEASALEKIPAAEVTAALDALNDDFRTAVLLCDVEGLSYAEIAEVTDVPVGTVMSRIHRGRRALQKSLWTYAREHGLVDEAVSG